MSNTGYQDSNKGFGSKEDVYTKEELMKFLRRDSDEYSHAMYYKLTLTLMHKMLGEDHEVYQLTNDEIEELKKCPKTEALDTLLRLSVNTTFHLRNGMIKQIEKAMIGSNNQDYVYVKEKYLDDMLYYFIRDNYESYKDRANYSGLTIKDILENLQSKSLNNVVMDILGDFGNNINYKRVDELFKNLDFDEGVKQSTLCKIIKEQIDYKGHVDGIKSLFNFVEDKEKLFSGVKSLIGSSDKNKKILYLESAYLGSKIENGFKDEHELINLEKKRL